MGFFGAMKTYVYTKKTREEVIQLKNELSILLDDLNEIRFNPDKKAKETRSREDFSSGYDSVKRNYVKSRSILSDIDMKLNKIRKQYPRATKYLDSIIDEVHDEERAQREVKNMEDIVND